MKTLARAALTTSPPEPLPWIFPQFEANGIVPRRGTVTMIAATPSSGKTFLVTKWIEKLAEPTLFFSADTDPETMLVRCAAIATGDPQAVVFAALKANEGGREYYAERLSETFPDVRWVWESDPTYDDLTLETTAFAEVYGDFPKQIVIDNLMNVVGENESEWSSMRDTTKAIHRLVRITGAHVFVLHHMSENNNRPEYPAPRKDLQGKVSQLPELIISLAASDDGDVMRAAAVKNRFGVQDRSATSYVEIPVDLDNGSFYANRANAQNGYAL